VQVGDATFTPQAPPAIPIAGDPDGGGPTYATLATKSASLLAASTAKIGSPVSATVAATGDVTNPTGATAPETTISAFDDTTKHNVPKVFADYRAKAGLQTIGFGISEPFMATVKVAGAQKAVMIQVFERRVLTYTASNPDAFKVEMGNIGQHYYKWRYPNGTQAAPASSAPAPSATAPSGIAGSGAVPTAGAGGSVATFGVTISDVIPTVKVGDIQTVNVLTNGGKTGCSLDVTYAGNTPAALAGRPAPQLVDSNGKISWSWAIGSEAKPGTANLLVQCTVDQKLGTASSSFTVSG
jgi:hypothetical protein